MIKRKIDPFLISVDKKMSKLMSKGVVCKEEDILNLLADMRELTEALNVLYRDLSKRLMKFVDKN